MAGQYGSLQISQCILSVIAVYNGILSYQMFTNEYNLKINYWYTEILDNTCILKSTINIHADPSRFFYNETLL